MRPREIAEALEKNYHTTRSLLRKMAEAGEVRRFDGQYIAASADTGHRQWRPSDGVDQKEQLQQQQPTCSDAIDYVDYTDYADDTPHASFTEGCNLSEAAAMQETLESIRLGEDRAEGQQAGNQPATVLLN